MIAIIKKSKSDYSSEIIIDWLNYYKASYLILTEKDILNFSCDKKEIDKFNSINVVLYRGLNFSSEEIGNNTFLLSEFHALKNYLFYILKSKKWFPDFNVISINKIEVLIKANEVGLKIPPYQIVTSKNKLIDFKKKYRDVIAKTISDNNSLNNNVLYSVIIEDDNIKEIPDYFFPSFIQKAIKPLFEIRVFYLDGVFYSSAILSSVDKIDYRKYYNNDTFHEAPYCIPHAVELKLKRLIDIFKLNTCSIDLILDENGNYFFLEINPIGQFGMVSTPNNYHLERIFAETLITYDKKYEEK